MFERLDEIARTYADVEAALSDPANLADQDRMRVLGRQYATLRPIVEAYRAHTAAKADRDFARDSLGTETDPEMRDFLATEVREKEARMDELEERLRELLIPRDPNDDKDVLVEIRAAAGGDEAALFAGDLLRMYQRFAERRGFKTDLLSATEGEQGGFKEAILEVRGDGAYSVFKHEGGPHRVQRVPKTESAGRIHTSTATVAVLPAVEDVEVELNMADVEIDVYRSTGPGGQSVNTTDSAVRLTHKPTGLVVTCQDEKSQLQNKEKALRILRARLYKMALDAQQGEQAATRRAQVGGGDRAEKVRSYNFPDNRVTDHRIGLKLNRLDEILEGDLDDLVNALLAAERAAQLASATPA